MPECMQEHMQEHTLPDFSLTTLKFPDFSMFSRFSRWVATLLLTYGLTITWGVQMSVFLKIEPNRWMGYEKQRCLARALFMHLLPLSGTHCLAVFVSVNL